MKNLLLATIVTLSSLTCLAQSDELDSKWLTYIVESERHTIFMQSMNLEGAADSTFWVIFKDYEADMEKLRIEYIQDLKTYAAKYNTMTSDEADRLMKRHYARELSRTITQRKYHKKITKQIDGLTAARFVQIDNSVSMIMKLSALDEIPFIGDK